MVCGQGASRILGSASCSELGLLTVKKADGFAETQAATWRQCHPGNGENAVFLEGDRVSLNCLSLDPELELVLLPFMDFYSLFLYFVL